MSLKMKLNPNSVNVMRVLLLDADAERSCSNLSANCHRDALGVGQFTDG